MPSSGVSPDVLPLFHFELMLHEWEAQYQMVTPEILDHFPPSMEYQNRNNVDMDISLSHNSYEEKQSKARAAHALIATFFEP